MTNKLSKLQRMMALAEAHKNTPTAKEESLLQFEMSFPAPTPLPPGFNEGSYDSGRLVFHAETSQTRAVECMGLYKLVNKVFPYKFRRKTLRILDPAFNLGTRGEYSGVVGYIKYYEGLMAELKRRREQSKSQDNRTQ